MIIAGFHYASMAAPAVLAPPTLNSTYASVYDATNGWPLYEKAQTTAFTSGQAASIAKLMTSRIVLARKSGVLDSESVTFTAGDVTSGSQMGLGTNDVTTWRHLLYGMLLPSGNEAASLVARIIGTEIFVENGSTGNTGVTRFVEAMNAEAASLGMSGTTFTSPHGDGSWTSTAEDLAMLGATVLTNATIQTISGTATHTVTITGANARTFDIHHTSNLINETGAAGGLGDDNVLASKTGSNGANTICSLCTLWEAPGGQEIVIVTIAGSLDGHRYMDQRAIMYQLCTDFPYLAASVGSDPQWANVKLLIGADGSIVDESAEAQSITVTDATINTTRPANGTGDIALNGTSSVVSVAHDTSMNPGTSDWALEFTFRGNGAEPGSFTSFAGKYNTDGNQRGFLVRYAASTNRFLGLISTDGTSFDTTTEFELFGEGNLMEPLDFFNGAPRKIMLRRSGTEIALYVNGKKGTATYTIGASAVHSSTAPLTIGARPSTGGTHIEFIGGHVDEVRLTIGNARATGAKYTPSPQKFPRS